MAPKVTPLPDFVIAPRTTRNTGAAAKVRKMKLRYPELSESQIAKRVGCNPATAHRVLKHFFGKGGEASLRNFQENKADIFDALQQKMLMSITAADIAKAPLLPRITGAAILEDKARTIRGQATQINVSVLLDAVQAVRDMRSKQ